MDHGASRNYLHQAGCRAVFLKGFLFTRSKVNPGARGGVTVKRGYLWGAPGVLMKPPNSFRPSGMVTVRALAVLLPSFAP
jgi:hypothetical protein